MRSRLDSVAVDPFTLVVVGGLGALVLVFWLLGRYYPGSGLEQLGLSSARELAERREALEAEDLDQMLSAHNARRRARRGRGDGRGVRGAAASRAQGTGMTARTDNRWLAA